MARQVLPIVGGIFGGQIGFAIGSIIGNIVDPQRIRAPGLKELPVMGVTEGAYRQVVYGTSVVRDCQLIDWGDLDVVVVEERQGKGGGPIVESERLYQTYAVGIGEPVEAIRYIKRNGVMVYDVRPGSTILAESAEFASRFRFYSGAESQLPDPDLEALPRNGVGNTPAYRGTSYFVMIRDDLTDSRGQIPTYEVEVVQSGAAFVNDVALVTNTRHYSGGATALSVATADLGFPLVTSRVAAAPNGLYAAGSDQTDTGTDRFSLFKFNAGTDTWAALALPAFVPDAGPNDMAWSPDSNYLAIVFNSFPDPKNVVVYKRTGDTFAAVADPATFPANAGISIAWNADGTKLAVGLPNTGTPAAVYDFDAGTDTLSGYRLTAAIGLGNVGQRVAFPVSAASDYLAVGGSSAIMVFDTTADPMPLRANVADLGDSDAEAGIHWVHGDDYLISVGANNLPNYIRLWAFDSSVPGSETLTFYAHAADQPASEGRDSAMTLDGNYLAVGVQGSAVPWIADCTGSPPTGASLASADATTTDVISLDWGDYGGGIQIEAGNTTLEAIVADICDRCGIPAGKLDLAALTDVVRGVTLGGSYDGAGAITTLMPAFLFDLYEADRELHAVKRGGAVVETLTVDDLLDEPDENTLRGQGIEYPRSLQLKYLNPGQDYAAPAATVTNKTVSARVTGEVQIDIPVSFDETEALNVAARMLKVMWEDVNGEAVFSLPSGPFAWLTPTDCLGLSLRDALYRIRVEKVEQSGGQLKVTARRDRQSAYTSNLTAIALPTPAPPPPSLAGDTTFVPMNLPGLVDGDDALGFHFAMTGQPGTAWRGANIAYRVSGAVDWINLGNFTTRAVMGELTAALPAASEFYTDTTNTLAVTLVGTDELETITEAQFLSEGNPAAIVYADGTAEIVQFKTVADVGVQAWSLTTLQRGRLATVPGPHLSGASFVMLAGTEFVTLPTSLIGQSLEFRVTSFGNSPETAPVYSFDWNPVHSQREFTPANLALTRAVDTVTAVAVPRHRFGTEDAPVASAEWTGYRFTATDGVNTTTTDTASVTPTAAFDVTGWASPVTVTVAMTNRFTGAGPTLSESIA